MDCRHASRMMSARLDGSLKSTDIARLEDHVSGCGTCQTEWQNLQALDSLLSVAPMLRAPARVRVRVMARLSRRDQARRAIIGGTALTLGTVALALLALAPTLLGLLNATGIAPALISGGPETVTQLLLFLGTMGHALLIVIEKLALPLLSLIMCSLVFALAVNGIWMGAMRRLHVRS